MRAQEIIRGLLDIMDAIEQAPETPSEITISTGGSQDEVRRFDQIADLLAAPPTAHANEPAETYADIEAVTSGAGGGVNGPKHPSDIRANSISMYPNYQAGAR